MKFRLNPQEKYGFPRCDFHETQRRWTASRADIEYLIVLKLENMCGKYISPIFTKFILVHWRYMEIIVPSFTQISK